jgi:hypothetical protein
LIAWIGSIDDKLGEDTSRPRRHHHDAARKIDRLEHRMSDEHYRLAKALPQRQQVVVELEACDLVERRKRLIHERSMDSVTSARAIETRIFMPPDSSRG